jgi:hypothetical protein
MLQDLDTVVRRIESGESLLLAADEPLLAALPRGPWVGGTIPYFLHDTGIATRKQLYAVRVPGDPVSIEVRRYPADQLSRIPQDTPEQGYSLLVIPAGGEAHHRFAREAPNYPDIFRKAVVGWIAGVHLDEVGIRSAKVVDGTSREMSADMAVALHATLPVGKLAVVRIDNPFRQGSGDTIRFEQDGFEAEDCLVNGQPRNLARYLTEIHADSRWPLVADYMGTMVNVSFQSVDPEPGRVVFYAPVFREVDYRLAEPPPDGWEAALGSGAQSSFTCSCILNYLYGKLEGRPLLGARGPATFGEIAHQLLNQTTVFLDILDQPGAIGA